MGSRSFINVFCTLDNNRRNSLLEALNKESTESGANIANVIKDMNIENLNMILDISSTEPVVPEPVVPEPVVPETAVPVQISSSQRVYNMRRERAEEDVADWIVDNFKLLSPSTSGAATSRSGGRGHPVVPDEDLFWLRRSSMRLVDIHRLYREQGGTESNKMISRILSGHFGLNKRVISCKTNFYGIIPIRRL